MHVTTKEKNGDFKRKDLCELVFPPLKLESGYVKRKSGKDRTKPIFLDPGSY